MCKMENFIFNTTFLIRILHCKRNANAFNKLRFIAQHGCNAGETPRKNPAYCAEGAIMPEGMEIPNVQDFPMSKNTHQIRFLAIPSTSTCARLTPWIFRYLYKLLLYLCTSERAPPCYVT